MQSIHTIRFNNNVYHNGSHFTLLLYEHNGVAVAIPLPNSDLMSFVRVFNNIIECRNHIETNLQKLVTLFGYDDNIRHWLSSVDNIPPNLAEIKIFCPAEDRLFATSWTRRYRKRFENITFDIINFEELNYRLLLFGIDHLKQLHSDFQPDSPELQQLVLDYKRVCHALANYFWWEANR
ncbi:unnamed protein product [Rotaria socialis]|uniref:Uncharacterized protein n=1 Tax=Rotaria socialis TaxID=392032 RepID=A0A819A673_9BILA|nr:unnamed protein product [Rotaria socialis]CAF3238035.1 unnamed protein product [Rotaria socialis]CAF3367749.1 unnamed protein product [Rotaria socialis]CAF3389553.1 unnamed protein product [Rotaria socialis]CAF3773066.1 unnamed protein product [Rotaria socialis]